METDRPKTNATETLTDLVLEFLEAAVHEFLFAWHVYPREAFEPRVLYDVPIHMSRHPLLCEYIHSMLTGCRTWLRRGELEKLCIILLSEEGRAVETLAIEPGWSAAFLEAASADEDYPLPLVALEEAFRAGMVALVATPVPDNMNQTDSNNSSPQTFRILAQTVEDACNQDTSIDEKNAGNSWVLADPFWCEGQKKPKEIYPVKSIQSQVSPIRLNVYIEKQQTAAVTEYQIHLNIFRGTTKRPRMTRLGLSDSMRSDVALEDTEPLHTATHRRTPRRTRAAPPTATAEASSAQQRRTKNALLKPFRSLFGAVLGVFLVFAALRGLLSTLSVWQDTSEQVAAQFEQLETRISLLGRGATRLKTTADAFLKRCQEAQVAASTRTEMFQTSARKSVEEQTKTQLQEHAEVVKEVMKYYAQQEQKIHETRERLMEMNVTLPVQITMSQVPERWEKEQRLLGDGDVLDQQQEVADDRLENAMEKLSFIAERTLEGAGTDGRLSVEHIVIQKNSETREVETRSDRQATSHGSIVVFYAFVVFVSASYLWTAVLRSGKKELKGDKMSWSPVPKVLGRLKTLLTSVVVIEDLRESNSESGTSHTLEHIEHIEF